MYGTIDFVNIADRWWRIPYRWRSTIVVATFVVGAGLADRCTGLRGHMPWLVPFEMAAILVLGVSRRDGHGYGPDPRRIGRPRGPGPHGV